MNQSDKWSYTKRKKNIFEKSGPDVMDCLGKEYDGTSNMSAEAWGMQAHIKELWKSLAYTNCCWLHLSLIIFLQESSESHTNVC